MEKKNELICKHWNNKKDGVTYAMADDVLTLCMDCHMILASKLMSNSMYRLWATQEEIEAQTE